MKKFFGVLTTCTFVLILIACSSDDSSEAINPIPVSFDRTAMLTNWADNIILPGYEDFVSKLGVLEMTAQEFTTTPDASTLAGLKNSWFDAYATWQRVSMFEIGPAETVDLRLNLNIYPSDVALIENHISTGNYNLDLSSNRVAKGFPALDYLINNDTDSNIVTRYETSANTRQYLMDVIADITALSMQVRDEWQGDFRDSFVANSGSSSTASVDRFVNDYIFYYERFLRAGKMGIPGGVFSGTTAPQNIEGIFKGDVSKAFFLEGLNAVQGFFNGDAYNGGPQGESLNSYLDALNTVKDGVDLNTVINTQFDEARFAVQSLGTFVDELSVNPPTTFLTAYDEVQRIVPLLKVDMVSAMSISIDFADADGD